MDDRHAGAEDFPNTLEPLGKIAAEDWSSQGDWEQFSDRPQPVENESSDTLVAALPSVDAALQAALPALPRTSAFPGEILSNGLAKSTAFTFVWEIDSAAGVAVLVRIDDAVLKTQSDTLVFALGEAWDDPERRGEALRWIRGSTIFKLSEKRLDYVAQDTDENGLLDRGRFLATVPALGGTVRQELSDYVGGPDGSLGGSDDALTLHARLHLSGSDTLEAVWTRDADGDGLLFGEAGSGGSGGSGKVRIERVVHEPLLRPRVLWARQTYLAIAFRDGSDPIPLRYREEREMQDGGSILVQAHGIGADSTLTPGDTARIRVETDFPDGSPRLDRQAVFTVILGDDPTRFRDWRMLRYAMVSRLASGPIASVTFMARLDAPSEPGQLRAEGEFEIRSELREGGTATLEGSLRNRKLEAELTVDDEDGVRKYSAAWDEGGILLEKKKKE